MRFYFRPERLIESLLLILLVISASHAQQPDFRKVPVVFTLPGMEKVAAQRDVSFKSAAGAELKMDVYYPPGMKSGAARLPAVIFVNGVGAPDLKDWQVYVDWGRLTAATGLIAITYQSRAGEAMTDSADLINYVRTNAAALRIDENRMGIWSCSANVRVSLPLVMEESRKYIRTAVFYYGVMIGEKMRFDIPVLVARAGQDSPSINNTIDAFVQRAIAQDVPLTFINYVDGQHAFDVRDDNEQTREIVKQTLAFLKFHLLKTEDLRAAAMRAPTPGRFMTLIANEGIQKALQVFEEAKKSDPQATLFREGTINTLAYELLQDKRNKEALELFKLNVAAYPQSANAYDSLGDAYEANGDKEMAIQSALKALELLNKDTNLDEAAKAPIRNSAAEKLKRLKEQK